MGEEIGMAAESAEEEGIAEGKDNMLEGARERILGGNKGRGSEELKISNDETSKGNPASEMQKGEGDG
jgi:hypothetical protein